MGKPKNKISKNEDKMQKKKNEKAINDKLKENIVIEQENNEQVEASILEEDISTQEVDPQALLKEEYNQLNDKYLRLNAEFQNYRKRVEKEKSDIFKYGHEKLFIEMLPIMDNFERALTTTNQENSESKILDGVLMIKKSFDDFFEKNGVKKIEAMNQTFDPIKHHAVMTEDIEGVDSECVVAVLQDGYLLNDKIIRPSMVKVSN